MSDNRQLKNRFKQTFVPPGVFVIRNTVNQWVYLGASSNPQGAMNRHRFELAMRGHRNPQLQSDWVAHGAQVFRFEVLDQIRQNHEPDFDYTGELAALLQLWREELVRSGAPSYNPVPAAVTARPVVTLES
ncbi:MAG: GIY-YIG nuclease family protein [Betaproteobacteria bacterium]